MSAPTTEQPLGDVVTQSLLELLIILKIAFENVGGEQNDHEGSTPD